MQQRRFFQAGVVFACCVLASCAKVTRSLPPAGDIAVPEVDTRGAQIYRIDAAESSLHILVFRGGTLARLGHNHVVSSTSMDGRAWLHPQFERSGFQLSLPVQSLIVDDPRARSEEGADFPPGIPSKDVEGTRKNMLRPELLDGERYPVISLQSMRIAGPPASPLVNTRITIKDVSRNIEVPTKLTIAGSRFIVSGEFEILQTQFGIKPFSIAMGALEVQDRLRVKFNIVAYEAGSDAVME